MVRKIIARVKTDYDLQLVIFWNALFLVIVLVHRRLYGREPGEGTYAAAPYLYALGMVLILWRWKRNRRVLYGYRLSPLKTLGFELENRKDYWGYKGNYRGYFFRIYYGSGDNVYDDGKIRFVLYYELPGHVPFNEIKSSLNSRYVDPSFFKALTPGSFILVIYKNSIVRREQFSGIFTFRQVKKRMDFMVDVAVKEGLTPLHEPEVNALIAADPDNAPWGYSRSFTD